MSKDQNSFLGLSDARTASDSASDLRAAIEKVRSKKQSNTSKMALLIVTGIFFFIVVGLNAGLKEVALLVGVLFFHEAGHALGMRIFGYKNVSIFFIPFLGALMTGRKENATAWQEALVSLMGPLPGLFLGIVLLPIFAGSENEILRNLPLLLLFLNGLNMLPFMPLDGGYFCNQVLFSRNRYLEATFSVFGILGLLALAFFLRWWAIGIFALLMIIVVIHSVKLRSIAHDISLHHGDSVTIENDAVLLKVNEEVRNRFQTKTVEQRAGLIGEILKIAHHRPPKARATALLLLLYLAPLPLTGLSALISAHLQKDTQGEERIAEGNSKYKRLTCNALSETRIL